MRSNRLSAKTMGRLLRGVGKRLRLLLARVRYPNVVLGSRCDLRKRLEIRVLHGGQIVIGENCILDNDLTIECSGKLTIGSGTIFGHHCTLAVRESLEIGRDCMFAEMVSIRDHDHCFEDATRPYRDQGMIVSPVVIGTNVWLGAKVTVVRGVTIGDNAVIGANAVVTRNIPANSIAVGIPARVIRQR